MSCDKLLCLKKIHDASSHKKALVAVKNANKKGFDNEKKVALYEKDEDFIALTHCLSEKKGRSYKSTEECQKTNAFITPSKLKSENAFKRPSKNQREDIDFYNQSFNEYDEEAYSDIDDILKEENPKLLSKKRALDDKKRAKLNDLFEDAFYKQQEDIDKKIQQKMKENDQNAVKELIKQHDINFKKYREQIKEFTRSNKEKLQKQTKSLNKKIQKTLNKRGGRKRMKTRRRYRY